MITGILIALAAAVMAFGTSEEVGIWWSVIPFFFVYSFILFWFYEMTKL